MDVFTRLLDRYRTQSAAAKALGVSRQTFSIWKKRGIPPGQALPIEEATRGYVTAKDVLLHGREQQ